MARWVTFIRVENNEPIAINLDTACIIEPDGDNIRIDGGLVYGDFQDLMTLHLNAEAFPSGHNLSSFGAS